MITIAAEALILPDRPKKETYTDRSENTARINDSAAFDIR